MADGKSIASRDVSIKRAVRPSGRCASRVRARLGPENDKIEQPIAQIVKGRTSRLDQPVRCSALPAITNCCPHGMAAVRHAIRSRDDEVAYPAPSDPMAMLPVRCQHLDLLAERDECVRARSGSKKPTTACCRRAYGGELTVVFCWRTNAGSPSQISSPAARGRILSAFASSVPG